MISVHLNKLMTSQVKEYMVPLAGAPYILSFPGQFSKRMNTEVNSNMTIVKERSRLIFSEYTHDEKTKLDDLVGTMDKIFTYEDVHNRKIYLPTGMTNPIQKLFPNINIVDQSGTWWPHSHIGLIEHSSEPRNQMQKDCIEFVLDNAQRDNKVGMVLPPGGGKTFIGCYCALRVGLRTLIIAPTTNIKLQWAQTLMEMFNVPEDRILIVNSPREFVNVKADFVIVSQASLGALNREFDLERIMGVNKFGIKIIDEAHMFFHNIIKVDGSSNIRHNWYLTGTFGRSAEEENALYQQMFGDIKIFRVPDKPPTIFDRKPGDIYGQKPHMNVFMCWGSSGLTPEQQKKVSSSMRYSDRAGKWMRYGVTIPGYTNIVIPPDGAITKFLQQILNVVKMAHNQVRYGKMLILTPTIDSVEIMAGYVRQMFPKLRIGTIHSRNKKLDNDNAKENCDIMISTVKSCGTGFDVKDLSKLVVAEQFKSWILADQVSGRLRRRPDGKDTYMWDIVDADMPQLRAWANARANVLKKKAKLFKVIDLE